MVAYKSLKTKEKSSWVIPKVVAVAYGSGHLQEFFIAKFKSQFKWGFAKVVVTRAGRLREWSQGELRLYLTFKSVFLSQFSTLSDVKTLPSFVSKTAL